MVFFFFLHCEAVLGEKLIVFHKVLFLLIALLTPVVVVLPSHPPILQTPTGCPPIHLNPDTNHLGLASYPQVNRLSPTGLPPLKCQVQVPDHRVSDQKAIN